MRLASALVVACCAVLAPGSNAQDSAGLCGLNDAECLEAQVVRQCGSRTDATVQSCVAWIQSIQARARSDDRVAWRQIAGAHVTISLRTTDYEERSFHRYVAREIYADLVERDAGDIDALSGMATVARDLNERIDLLRKVVSIAPNSMEAEFLANALTDRGGTNDVLEAAEVLEAFYRRLPKGTAWADAARAVALYESAGALDRSQYLRERVHDDVGPAALVSELQRIPETTSVRAAQVLSTLCRNAVVDLLGGNACLEGLREMSGALTRLPDRAGALEFAEVLAGQISSTGNGGWESVTREAEWQSTISSIFLEMEAASIESFLVLMSRATRLREMDPAQKLRLFERAAALAAPDDGSALLRLASEYMLLGRFTDALTLLRRARELPATTDSRRESIDSFMADLERMERASRESGATR